MSSLPYRVAIKPRGYALVDGYQSFWFVTFSLTGSLLSAGRLRS